MNLIPDNSSLQPATPPPRHRGAGEGVTWGIWDLVLCLAGVILLVLLVSVAIVLPVTAATSEDAQEAMLAQFVGVALWDLAIVLLVYWFVRRKGGSWRSLGFRPAAANAPTLWHSRRWGLIAVVLGMYLASILTVVGYTSIVDLVGLDDLLPGKQLKDDFFEHTAVVITIGFSVVVAAPIAEEVFFRGFFFAGLRRYLGFPMAALLSGVLFSLAHGNLGLVIPFTLVGAILAFTYERTRTIYANISVHFVFNFLSFMALVLFPEARN